MRAPRRPVRLLLHSECRSASRERAKRGRPRPLSLGFIPTKFLSFLQSPAVAPTMLLSQDMHVRKRSPWPAIGLLVTLALARGEFAVANALAGSTTALAWQNHLVLEVENLNSPIFGSVPYSDPNRNPRAWDRALLEAEATLAVGEPALVPTARLDQLRPRPVRTVAPGPVLPPRASRPPPAA